MLMPVSVVTFITFMLGVVYCYFMIIVIVGLMLLFDDDLCHGAIGLLDDVHTFGHAA